MATRTWVSGVGDDVNPGSRTAPCKTFAGAISKTDAGGEINAIDPGGFGAVTITKALTIDGGTGSGWASILAAATNGIIINAPSNATVRLRNLSINGFQTGLTGIRIVAARAVIIEDCEIFGFAGGIAGIGGIGVHDVRSAGGSLGIINSNINSNVSALVVRPATGTTRITVSLENVRAYFNAGHAIIASSGVAATVSRSVLSFSGGSGLVAEQPSGTTEVNVEGCVFTSNSTGITVISGTPTVRLSDSTIVNNTTGIALSGGTVSSYGNNRIEANGSGNAPSAGLLPLK
jgi:hypothetical protein